MFIGEPLPPPTPWQLADSINTSGVDWAETFMERNPATSEVLSTEGLALWFLQALISGYRAGMSHAPFPAA